MLCRMICADELKIRPVVIDDKSSGYREFGIILIKFVDYPVVLGKLRGWYEYLLPCLRVCFVRVKLMHKPFVCFLVVEWFAPCM